MSEDQKSKGTRAPSAETVALMQDVQRLSRAVSTGPTAQARLDAVTALEELLDALPSMIRPRGVTLH
jgi:hypothetical protein